MAENFELALIFNELRPAKNLTIIPAGHGRVKGFRKGYRARGVFRIVTLNG